MPFNIGERVRHCEHGNGTVIAKNGMGNIGVEFDNPTFRGHNCSRNVVVGHSCTSGRGYWCREGELRHINTANDSRVVVPGYIYRIGERVKYIGDMWEGALGTIICIRRSGSYGVEFDGNVNGHNCDARDIIAGSSCTSGRGWYCQERDIEPTNL